MFGRLFHLKPQSNNSWRMNGIGHATIETGGCPANRMPALASHGAIVELALLKRK